jgi:hypothetical protein
MKMCCGKDRKPYSEEIYRQALARRHQLAVKTPRPISENVDYPRVTLLRLLHPTSQQRVGGFKLTYYRVRV